MPTINQLIKKSRIKPIARNKVPALEKQPLKRLSFKCWNFIPGNRFNSTFFNQLINSWHNNILKLK